MRIDLTEADVLRLAEHAKNAGFEDVEQFAAAHLMALAHQPASLSDAELQESLVMIDQSQAEIDAGKGLTVEQARQLTVATQREQAE